MRTPMITAISVAAALLLSSSTHALRLSEPVDVDATHETFGAVVDNAPSVISLERLMTNPEAYLDSPVAVETRVAQVCQKKGCFFIAQEGAMAVRVSFKDYSFFVPTDISGKTVTLVGALVQRELSEEQASHFNSDAGEEGAGLRAGPVYELVASSVRVPRG